jgi:spore coat protein A, manganese oxidase
MGTRDRREFLKLCAAGVPALAFAKRFVSSGQNQRAVAPSNYRTPATLDWFIDPLPIPKTLSPQGTDKGVLQYRIAMREFQRQVHSQLPPTRLWGYEGQYPGPTIQASRGTPIVVEWQNQLPLQHLLAIDPHIHGAMPPAPAVRTVPHLHGSRSRSEDDGLPERWFAPGQSVQYHYPNNQLAATLWYHDHAIGITRLNIYAGLSGFYFLRDEEERIMDLPSGNYEIPLLLQDRTLDDQGQLAYSPTHEDARPLPPGVWGPEFFGSLPVANGVICPYLDVEPRAYRLRFLNGCNSRFLNLFLNLAKSPSDIPALVPMHQIGTDGGFLSKPIELEKILLGPAERADVVVDFSRAAGKTVTLSNRAPAPFPGWQGVETLHAQLYEFMQFRVRVPLAGNPKAFSVPPSPHFAGFDESRSVTTRDFVLTERLDNQGRSLGVRINEKEYEDPVTESPKLGSIEKWRFLNTTDDSHPMHLHLVQFQILERQGFDPAALRSGNVKLIGPARPPQPNEAGRKDTAVVNPGEVLTLLIRFDGYAGRYVFHCHMLEHEDNDMMRPYEVIP